MITDVLAIKYRSFGINGHTDNGTSPVKSKSIEDNIYHRTLMIIVYLIYVMDLKAA
jgi:hypothetical protein